MEEGGEGEEGEEEHCGSWFGVLMGGLVSEE